MVAFAGTRRFERCAKNLGGLAQLGERLAGSQKVIGSSPLSSIGSLRGSSQVVASLRKARFFRAFFMPVSLGLRPISPNCDPVLHHICISLEGCCVGVVVLQSHPIVLRCNRFGVAAPVRDNLFGKVSA